MSVSRTRSWNAKDVEKQRPLSFFKLIEKTARVSSLPATPTRLFVLLTSFQKGRWLFKASVLCKGHALCFGEAFSRDWLIRGRVRILQGALCVPASSCESSIKVFVLPLNLQTLTSQLTIWTPIPTLLANAVLRLKTPEGAYTHPEVHSWECCPET